MEDTDVSARKVAPARRPHLRHWLTDPEKLAAWDILVCSKQDRLFRSVADLGPLTAWCLENDKAWASVAENTDLSTPAGRAMAHVLATFAEFEADRIGERCRESADRLAQAGRWRGGRIPYGYAPRDTGNGWTLVLDETQAATLRAMAEQAIAGWSNGQIARWLKEQQIPSPHGRDEWQIDIVRVKLRSPSLAGWSVRNGKVVRDDDGNPVMITSTPVLDGDTWNKLQDALDSRKQNHGERVGGHMLLRVSYCGRCSTRPVMGKLEDGTPVPPPPEKLVPMYGHSNRGKRAVSSNYRCQQRGLWVLMAKLEARVEQAVLDSIGDKRLPRKVVIPAVSHTAELAGAERRIAEIDGAYDAGDLPMAAYARQMKKWEATRERLAALPQREAQVRYGSG